MVEPLRRAGRIVRSWRSHITLCASTSVVSDSAGVDPVLHAARLRPGREVEEQEPASSRSALQKCSPAAAMRLAMVRSCLLAGSCRFANIASDLTDLAKPVVVEDDNFVLVFAHQADDVAVLQLGE